MTRALVVIDVQNDFCEGGALACQEGASVAAKISSFIRENSSRYELVVASRDWHTPNDSNDGHFPAEGNSPDYISTWPLHCIQGTEGAEYHPNLDTNLIDVHIKKGQSSNGYSIFDGVTEEGESFAEVLRSHSISELEVVGIATDYCVRASALDSVKQGFKVRVISSLTAGVSEASTERAIAEMLDAGVDVSSTI